MQSEANEWFIVKEVIPPNKTVSPSNKGRSVGPNVTEVECLSPFLVMQPCVDRHCKSLNFGGSINVISEVQ